MAQIKVLKVGMGKGWQIWVLFGGRINRICQRLSVTSGRKVTVVICSGHIVLVGGCHWEMIQEIRSLIGEQNKEHHLLQRYFNLPFVHSLIPFLALVLWI